MNAMYNPSHPGEILQEYMEGLSLSITALAAHLKTSRVTLSRILNARASITADMALRLADALGTTPDFWLRLQMQHDLWVASQGKRPQIAPIHQAA